MQSEHSPFKRLIVKLGGKYELAFIFIFIFYMAPRIFLRNKNWLRDTGIFKTIIKVMSYYGSSTT
jgi:hypothetical protein